MANNAIVSLSDMSEVTQNAGPILTIVDIFLIECNSVKTYLATHLEVERSNNLLCKKEALKLLNDETRTV